MQIDSPAEGQTPDRNGSTPGLFRSLLKGIPTIIVLAVIASGWMVMHHINSSGSAQEEVVEGEAAAPETDTLVLPSGKLKAGKFESVPAQQKLVQHVHTVPGRLRYDQTKRVDVKAPLDGILAELLVTPGDHVATGDLIAVLQSPEIGQSRAEILRRQQQRDIAQSILEREVLLANNLEQMSEMLDEGQSTESIETAFADRALGAYRQEILSAYTRRKLADDWLSSVRPLAEQGAVSGRTVRERENERQLADTLFRTARDQAKFSADQARLKAAADVAEAERQLQLAWLSLDSLLGCRADRGQESLTDENSIARLEVRAPFAGTIESRGFASDDRVQRGDSLVVLANTDWLTVEASIRESDWMAVSLQTGTEVAVLVPALSDRSFSARVRYFGREVQADTNSVPLVAEIENREGLLRPGMFVRVVVPIGDARQALSIKPESVIQHDNQQFVFLDLKGGTFKRVDVSLGQATDDWVEVTSGLAGGQLVVTNGAFLLKSELLLQGEGE